MNKLVCRIQMLAKRYRDFVSQIKEDHETRRIAANTAWLVLEKIIRMFTGVLLGVLVARYLRPEQYGLYSYTLAIVIILSGFADLGLNQIVVRELIKEPQSQEEIVSTAFFLKLAAGLCSMGLAFAVAFLLTRDSTTLRLILLLSIRLLFKSIEIIDFLFQSKVSSKYVTWSRSIAYVATGAAIAVAIFQGRSILTIALVSNLEFVISFMLIFALYLIEGYKVKISSFSIKRVCTLLNDSWPLILSGIAIVTYMRVDQIMIKLMYGDAELGMYSVAVRLTEALYLIPAAVVSSTLPKITQSYKESKESFYDEIQNLYNTVSLISYMSIFFVFIFADLIVSTVFGREYAASALVLRVLVWSALFVNLGVVQYSFMVVMNWTSMYMTIVFLASLLNIGLNSILIPKHGAIGATIATVISYWFVAHGSCFFHKSLYRTGTMITKALIPVK